ncbi:MAG: hypothetical protein AAB407_01810 [Patescibacteria group bacterium]
MTYIITGIANVISFIGALLSKMSRDIIRLMQEYELSRLPFLKKTYETFAESPESQWTISKEDVLRLYKLIRRDKPKKILELGTGVGLSSAVMASALRENTVGNILSLEQSLKCIRIANELIPQELQSFIDIKHVKPAVFKISTVSEFEYFCGYDWMPSKDSLFDFILVDGPAAWIQNKKLVTLDAGDIFRLIPYIKPGGKIFIDGRRSSANKINRYLSRYIRILEKGDDFTIFERTNLQVSSTDALIIADTKLSIKPSPYEELDTK